MTPALVALLLALQQVPPGELKGQVRAVGFEPGGAVIYLLSERLDSSLLGPETTVIDQREIGFVPRVSAVRPGARVQFRNSDPVLHNVFSPAGPGAGFNLGTYPRTEVRERAFVEPGAHVILCHVHPEMVAFVVVVATSYHAVSEPDGSFTVSGIPAGRYRLHVWRRLASPVEQEIQILPGRTVEVVLELVRARRPRR